jgi:hypothetical protein
LGDRPEDTIRSLERNAYCRRATAFLHVREVNNLDELCHALQAFKRTQDLPTLVIAIARRTIGLARSASRLDTKAMARKQKELF